MTSKLIAHKRYKSNNFCTDVNKYRYKANSITCMETTVDKYAASQAKENATVNNANTIIVK